MLPEELKVFLVDDWDTIVRQRRVWRQLNDDLIKSSFSKLARVKTKFIIYLLLPITIPIA